MLYENSIRSTNFTASPPSLSIATNPSAPVTWYPLDDLTNVSMPVRAFNFLMSMSLAEEKSVKKQQNAADEIETEAIIEAKTKVMPRKLKRRIKPKIIEE